jgi:hypothetical protein
MKVKTRLNRLIVKFRQATKVVKKSVDHRIKIDEIQDTAFHIAKKSMRNPKSTLMYAPISQTYYTECDHYCIRMVDNSISIINGRLSYHVWLPEPEMSELKRIFDRVAQYKSAKLESKYNQSTLVNLKAVLAEVNSTITKESYN